MKNMKYFAVVLSFVMWMGSVHGDNHFGIVQAEDAQTGTAGFYCMMYNPGFHVVPKDPESAELLAVSDLTPNVLCSEPPDRPIVKGKMVAVSRGNCTFSEKARNIQQLGGKVALIISSEGLTEPGANSSMDLNEINISVAVMAEMDFKKMKGLGHDVEAKLYAPDAPRVDFNLLLIWVMAVGTVIIGSFWSGIVKDRQRLRRVKTREYRPGQGAPDIPPQSEEEEETLDVSPKFILIFVVLMCAMLVSLYFLYDYLVYIIIALFTVASSAALYSCSKLLLIRIPCIGDCRIPPNRIPLLSQEPEIRRIVLALICLGIGVWWAVERNADYAWVLQNALGIVFCIHMLKTVRLSSLRAVTILLVLLFFYDIFFVFITPLITKKGQSIMVDVATGGGSSTGEMLPMVLKVPRFASSVLSVCSLPYSLLGYGDILVPGLLVAYCHGFDLKVRSKRIYFISTSIAYGVGLVITFLALALMNSGQPALLYLVPCTLLTVTAVGACRGELGHLWKGELEQIAPPSANEGTAVTDHSKAQEDGTVSNGSIVPAASLPETTVRVRDARTSSIGYQQDGINHVDNASFSVDNDQQHLIVR